MAAGLFADCCRCPKLPAFYCGLDLRWGVTRRQEVSEYVNRCEHLQRVSEVVNGKSLKSDCLGSNFNSSAC